MKLKRSMVTVAIAGLALSTAACGDDGDTARTGDSGDQEVTVTFSAPLCLAWWPFYAAEQQGFFEDAGVAVNFEGLDGSAAAIQATLSGKADIAVSAPDNYLTARAAGADIEGYFSFYQTPIMSLVTPTDSGINAPEDLAGKTVGISTPGGGDVPYARSLLASAGVEEGDYTELAVGDGGSAATALRKNEVDAYSASYFDEEIIKGTGIELNTLTYPDYPAVPGHLLVSTSEWLSANPGVVDAFGQALAEGIAWGLENPDQAVDVCAEVAPDETEDQEFAKTIVDRVAELVTLPASADGQYGVIDENSWAEYRDLLVQLQIVPDAASDVDIDNSHVEAWNEK